MRGILCPISSSREFSRRKSTYNYLRESKHGRSTSTVWLALNCRWRNGGLCWGNPFWVIADPNLTLTQAQWSDCPAAKTKNVDEAFNSRR